MAARKRRLHAQSLENSNNRKNLEFLPRTGRTSHANVREEMKANKEDLCRANVFIKMRSTKDGTIPNEDTQIVVDRMKKNLNEVPQSKQNDSFKEQVFIDLVGPGGHESVKNFGEGGSTRDVFGAHSSLRNTISSDAIERMVQAQVDAQLDTKVAERVADIVEEQVAQIDANVAEQVAVHVSNYENVQMEWFKKLELQLGRELPPPLGHHETRYGSSVGYQGL